MYEETIRTGRQQRLHGQYWTRPENRSGAIIVVHGLGDHGGRYKELAEQLTAKGWNVLAFDLMGHGLSPGARGRIDRYDGLLADIAHARQTVAQRTPDLPQVLLGHSMGGNLAVNYALRQQHIDPSVNGLAGLALSAPMLLPSAPPQRPHIFAAWITGHLFPWICLNKPVDPGLLTNDPLRRQTIQDDSRMHSRLSIYLATQLLSQGRFALDHARQVSIPTLIMYGEQDELIDTSACGHFSIRVGDSATLVTWPETRHELFHEVKRAQIIDRLSAWLKPLGRPTF